MMKTNLADISPEMKGGIELEVNSMQKKYPLLHAIDPALLHKLSEGDHAAFNTLYMAFADPLVEFLNSILRSEEDAKEITQEIFMNLWASRETINSIKKMKSYLFTSARNRAFNHLRSRNVRFRYHSSELAGGTEELDLSADEILQSRETAILIRAAIENMPPQRKKAFELSRMEGMTHDQIARELGIASGTVNNHIKLALKDIREILALCVILFGAPNL